MQEPDKENKYIITDILEADYGCEEPPSDGRFRCGLNLEFKGEKIYREVYDDMVDELCLVKGMGLTADELRSIEGGLIPEGWFDLTHRHYFETPIGPVCMSVEEYRDYIYNKGVF